MITAAQKEEFEGLFPFIQQASSEFVKLFYTQAQFVQLPAGESTAMRSFAPGDGSAGWVGV